MKVNKDSIIREVILNLISKCGKIEGRKKFMKLMFLVDHYREGKIQTKPLIGMNFIIYKHGVFSVDVMDNYIDLLEKEVIDETYIEDLNLNLIQCKGPVPKTNEKVEEVIDEVVNKFGKYNGKQLEEKTLEMIGIKMEEKENYYGMRVSEILKEHIKKSVR
jgi:uncharacterized phage-associated protein